LIGPAEKERIWERHIENCLPITTLIPADKEGLTLADVGSGAGLPGIVIALARPNLAVTLIEPIPRRVQFLNECLEELGLNKGKSKITVIKGKSAAVKKSFDYVTARAVAPLPRLLKESWHLVNPQGALLAIKGASVEGEIAGLTLPKGAQLRLLEINHPDLPSGRVVEIVKAG
jgi:16S rRNA (guanine527-N7)-methyltransferase